MAVRFYKERKGLKVVKKADMELKAKLKKPFVLDKKVIESWFKF